MAKFRKKPVEIEAIEWKGKLADIAPIMSPKSIVKVSRDGDLSIHTMEGVLKGDLGDMIIRGVKGELYACKPDVFALTYEAVEPSKIEKVVARVREATAAQEEVAEARKVISFGDRKPFVPQPTQETPEEPQEPPAKPVLDHDAIDLLEAVLIRARKGTVRGAIVLTGLPTSIGDPELVTDIAADISYSAGENVQIFLGGLETCKADLFELHGDIMLSEMDEVFEEGDDDGEE